MPTSVSSSTAYCSGAYFVQRYDGTTVGQLVKDDGTQDGTPASNTNLAELLLAASGEVEAACLVAGRYSTEDLAALSGASQAFLRKLVAAIAAVDLRRRRLRAGEQDLNEAKWVDDTLQRLRAGERIFALQEVVEAGEGMDRDDADAERYQTDNTLSYQARRFFGQAPAERRY